MNRLTELRKKKGLTQKEFSKILNVSVGAVGMWESGKRTPTSKTMKKIAEYFGMTIEDIFF